jgi:hypothetical protein
MAFCERIPVTIPNDGATPPLVTTTSGSEVDVGQLGGKGYDFIRDAGAGFTANLEGSVAGKNWTTITGLGASAQGTIPDQYTLVRVTASVAGALGATTTLHVAGRTQG